MLRELLIEIFPSMQISLQRNLNFSLYLGLARVRHWCLISQQNFIQWISSSWRKPKERSSELRSSMSCDFYQLEWFVIYILGCLNDHCSSQSVLRGYNIIFFASDAATEQNTLMSPFPELFSESFMGYPRFGRRNSHENTCGLHCSNEKT